MEHRTKPSRPREPYGGPNIATYTKPRQCHKDMLRILNRIDPRLPAKARKLGCFVQFAENILEAFDYMTVREEELFLMEHQNNVFRAIPNMLEALDKQARAPASQPSVTRSGGGTGRGREPGQGARHRDQQAGARRALQALPPGGEPGLGVRLPQHRRVRRPLQHRAGGALHQPQRHLPRAEAAGAL